VRQDGWVLAERPDELMFAFSLADLADRMAMGPFRSPQLKIWTKHDGTPVTDVDREIEVALRQRIAADRPTDGLVGEELGMIDGVDWRWYLDPVDGTTDYVAGRTGWKTLIALGWRDEIRLAVVSAPAMGRRWWAIRGHGAFRDGERLHVSGTDELAKATINDDWRFTLERGVVDSPLATLAGKCARIRPYDGQGILAVASGESDINLSVYGFVWDYAPMKLIVEEAGGQFTDIQGRAVIDGGNSLASNGRLHAQAADVLTECA
jgi:histidinol-phosphatase